MQTNEMCTSLRIVFVHFSTMFGNDLKHQKSNVLKIILIKTLLYYGIVNMLLQLTLHGIYNNILSLCKKSWTIFESLLIENKVGAHIAPNSCQFQVCLFSFLQLLSTRCCSPLTVKLHDILHNYMIFASVLIMNRLFTLSFVQNVMENSERMIWFVYYLLYSLHID